MTEVATDAWLWGFGPQQSGLAFRSQLQLVDPSVPSVVWPPPLGVQAAESEPMRNEMIQQSESSLLTP